MNKKVNSAFALFFLFVVGFSAFQCLSNVLQNTRKNVMNGYDEWMKSRKIRVTQPKKKIESPYGEPLPKKSPVRQPKKKKSSKYDNAIAEVWSVIRKTMIPERKQVEKWIISSFPFRDEFSTFNMAFRYHMGMVDPVETDTGVLVPEKGTGGSRLIQGYELKKEFSPGQLKELEAYKKFCAAAGIELHIVLRPRDSFHHEVWEPHRGLIYDQNSKLTWRADFLRKRGFPTFELWKELGRAIPEEKLLDYWYRTDHHWNVDGALLAAKLVADYMNRNCGMKYDLRYFDPDTYIRKTWRDVFYGSIGRKLSPAYAGEKEDFSQLHPRFATDFSFEIPGKKFSKRGDFSVLFMNHYIHYNSLHSVPYASFMGGSESVSRVVNHKIKDGKKIALIKDSFSLAMVPYLALQTKEIVLYDPRAKDLPRKKAHKKIRQMLMKEKPDILLIMFYNGI